MAIVKKLFKVRGVLSSRKNAPIVLNRHNHSKPLIAWTNEVESRARHEMEEKLDREHRKLVDIYGRGSMYALPHVLTGYQVDALRRLQEALYFALTAIVTNYSRDSRIQSTYEFEPKIKSLLNLYDGFPYRNVGSYRPDFLHEKHSMKPRLCEINARFVLNGYIISELGTSIILGLDSIKPWQAELSFTTPLSTSVLASLKNEFDLSKPIGLLKNREHGYDVNLFKSMVPEAYFIRPEELQLNKNGKLVFKQQETNEIEIEQFLVELHQDEIISLPFEIQKALVKSSKLFNDLRTVFIGHDKRFLTLLSRDEVLADYLSPKHHELIKSHRIRSVTSKEVIENRRLREEISENRGKWLLKPCLLGKGEGIRFGKDVASGKEWSNLVEKAASNYIFQEYIDQHKFDFTNRPGLNLIGTMLCLNEKFLGLGIYRAGREDLISLSKGGFFAFPAALKSTLDQNDESTIHRELVVPKEAQFHLSTYSFKDVESYKRELTENGLVIIDLDLDDEKKSDFFINLVRCLDMQPYAHTKKGDDFIWDIKPKLATTNSGPRSHRSDVFNMHTDASFEEQPPRYFGLLVLQADRYGAGHTLLIRLEDILDRLEADEIECLQSEQVEIEIPAEFRRNDHTKMIKGPILSPRRDLYGHMLIRYRADLIVDKKRQSSRFQATLAKLEKLIDLKGDLVQQTRLKPNQLLLVDNGRWLHGRSKIFDMERHLLRVRFQTKSKFMLPWEKTF